MYIQIFDWMGWDGSKAATSWSAKINASIKRIGLQVRFPAAANSFDLPFPALKFAGP